MNEARQSFPDGGTPKTRDDERRTALAQARWDRLAKGYDRAMSGMDGLILGKWRSALWSQVHGGRVLEIGVGTGANFPHYPEGVEITAIDLSDKMLEVAREKALRRGIKVDLRQMDAEQIDLPDASFDYVVATCVFCSVPDPVRGLREAARVCKPEGKILLLEHVRSESPFGYLMDVINPLWARLAGSNINRRTLENVRRAGMAIERVDSFFLGIGKLIVARPQPRSS